MKVPARRVNVDKESRSVLMDDNVLLQIYSGNIIHSLRLFIYSNLYSNRQLDCNDGSDENNCNGVRSV
jgi:hypothetical protein